MALPKRDLHMRGSVVEETCPTCKGKGTYRGPIPYPNCIRCAGFGTVVRIESFEKEAA